jgi:antitoxin (DNA-binding transcriptional repressor) of toxin-antitoxin stability system
VLDKYGYKDYNITMITVGVKNLKDQLSQYLQYVKNGERVIITEHNKIIAELSVPGKKENIVPFDQKLIELSDDGEVILAERNLSLAPKPNDKLNLDWRTAYNEIRADRF